MKKFFLRVLIAVIVTGLFLEVPSACAIMGLRAARTAIAARRAKQKLTVAETGKASAPAKNKADLQEIQEETVPAAAAGL